MTEISAAMGLTNLEAVDQFVAINRSNYRLYQQAIAQTPGLSLIEYDETERNNFQYVVLDVAHDFPASRDRVIDVLHAENVLARRYFWPGCHNMQPYQSFYPHAGLVLPNTNAIAERVVVLPTGSAITEADVQGICSILRALASGAP
jgi:dTDP-4-amino-4,6-dideoxygalactose transaminase